MMRLLLVVLFQVLLQDAVYSQLDNSLNTKESNYFSKVKVKITNFDLIPSGCGVMKFVSVYKASIIQPNYIFTLKEVLVFVECREAYGSVFSPSQEYYIDFKFFKPDLSTAEIINFSGISIDSMEGYKKVQLYKIRAASKR